jgi:uncharacterized protein (TIGR00730 family)
MKIGVFCSSSRDVAPMFMSEIETLGESLARDGHSVVYGGAISGCMGALGRGVRRAQGELVGVVPKMDFLEGLVEPDLTERHEVADFSERKTKMIQLADAFVVFPGGIGTLDEAFEVLALKSIGSVNKPIVFYNFLEVWDPLLEAMELLVQNRMIRHTLDDLITVIPKHENLREYLKHGH